MYSEDDLNEVTSVVGRAMHEVAEAVLELFRRRVAQPFAEAGGGALELMLRPATGIETTGPAGGALFGTGLPPQPGTTRPPGKTLRHRGAPRRGRRAR